MRTKEIALVYKSKPNADGKTSYVEFIGVANRWQDREVFLATCEITHYTPFFIYLNKKEWRKIKKDNQAILKKYTDAMDDLFRKAKDGELTN